MRLTLPPSGPLILAAAGGALIRLRHRRTGKLLIAAGLASLYLLSTGLVAHLLVGPLEQIYPPVAANAGNIDAVVVLSSGAKDLSRAGLGLVPGSESLTRLVRGIAIYRRLKAPRLVISGGKADPAKPGVSLGGLMAQTARDLGVQPDELVLEEGSKNTYEGALNLREFLKDGSRIVLVTHARHMGRSIALHRAAGFDVIPAPSDYTGETVSFHLESLIPSAGSLGVSSEALYEYLSRLWYLLRGVSNSR